MLLHKPIVLPPEGSYPQGTHRLMPPRRTPEGSRTSANYRRLTPEGTDCSDVEAEDLYGTSLRLPLHDDALHQQTIEQKKKQKVEKRGKIKNETWRAFGPRRSTKTG
eukprot:gene10370-19190_t